MELPNLLTASCVSTNKWLQIPEEQLRRYNAIDTYVTARVWKALKTELSRVNQLDFYHRWFRIVPVAIRMQRRGFGQCDWEALRSVETEITQECAEVESGIISQTRIFDELTEAAKLWEAADRAADWAAAHAKNNARKKLKPLEEVSPTRELSRSKRFTSKLRTIEERKASFFNKSADLRTFLFNELSLRPAPPSQREKRPARSVGDSAIRYMLEHLRKSDEPHRSVLADLSHIFRLRKILQGYIQPIRSGPQWLRGDRFYPVLRLYGTETLRWSYARPSMQNWPPRMLKIVRARPGHVFIAVDKKQIEAGVAALLAGDTAEVREWLDPDGDLHRLMSCDALGLTRPEWDTMDPERRTAIRQMFKTSRYERLYGGEGTKAKSKEGCPCDRCRKEETGTASRYRLSTKEMSAALGEWARRHPKMQRWRENHLRTIRDQGNTWVSPFGYRMTSVQPPDVAARQWLNRPMQHSVAMMINEDAIILDNLGCPLVFQHHDALFAEVPENEADYWKATMVEVMTRPIPEFANTRFPVDAKVGYSWKDLK